MHGMTDAQRAQFEAEKQKLEKLKVQTENMVKRLRGEEVESDKEVEGDLDLAPGRFEAEHGLHPERIQELVQLLHQVLEDVPADK